MVGRRRIHALVFVPSGYHNPVLAGCWRQPRSISELAKGSSGPVRAIKRPLPVLKSAGIVLRVQASQ